MTGKYWEKQTICPILGNTYIHLQLTYKLSLNVIICLTELQTMSRLKRPFTFILIRLLHFYFLTRQASNFQWHFKKFVEKKARNMNHIHKQKHVSLLYFYFIGKTYHTTLNAFKYNKLDLCKWMLVFIFLDSLKNNKSRNTIVSDVMIYEKYVTK